MSELLRVEGLKVHYRGPRRGIVPWANRAAVKAVDGVDLTIAAGRTLGLVGESGCGKSTLGRAILQLTEVTAGAVHFEDQDLVALNREAMRSVRRRLQIIFQDPYASLDPRRSIGYQVGEPLLLAGLNDDAERQERVADLFNLVGLDPIYQDRYPHEFSGGQRQRVVIARALATRPIFVVADEPVSALDVSVQAQVINLLRDLREDLGLSLLFISHDLRVVRYICDDVAVMYLGKIVEIASVDELFRAPKHPYTQALLSSVPRARWEGGDGEVIRLQGEVPSPIDTPTGCYFASRCPFVVDKCHTGHPDLKPAAVNHNVACYLVNDA